MQRYPKWLFAAKLFDSFGVFNSVLPRQLRLSLKPLQTITKQTDTVQTELITDQVCQISNPRSSYRSQSVSLFDNDPKLDQEVSRQCKMAPRRRASPVIKRQKNSDIISSDEEDNKDEEENGVIMPLVNLAKNKVFIKGQQEHDFTHDVTTSKAVTIVGFFRLANYLSSSAVIGVLIATVLKNSQIYENAHVLANALVIFQLLYLFAVCLLMHIDAIGTVTFCWKEYGELSHDPADATSIIFSICPSRYLFR